MAQHVGISHVSFLGVVLLGLGAIYWWRQYRRESKAEADKLEGSTPLGPRVRRRKRSVSRLIELAPCECLRSSLLIVGCDDGRVD